MKNDQFFPTRSVRGILALLIIMGMAAAESVQAGCLTAPVQIISASTNKDKCGFENPCDPTNGNTPIINVYLKSDEIKWLWMIEEGYYSSGMRANLTEQIIETEDPVTCDTIYAYSGSLTQVDYDDDGNISDTGSASITDPTAPFWSGTTAPQNIDQTYTQLGEDYGGGTNVEICSQAINGSANSGSWSGLQQASEDVTLYSVLFTDVMMRNIMLANLPAYPDWAYPNGGNAHYSLSPDHTHCDGSKMKYRFSLCSANTSQKNQAFLLKWKQTTTYPGTNTPPIIVKMSTTVIANGDPNGMYVYPDPPEVPVPEAPCTITESDADVTPIPGGGSSGPGGGGAKR